MSNEWCETNLIAAGRSAPDGVEIEWARIDQVTGDDDAKSPWLLLSPYAHDVLKIAASAIRDTGMSGLTGDHPGKRARLANLIDAVGDVVKELAADHACDGALTAENWNQSLARAAILAYVAMVPEGMEV